MACFLAIMVSALGEGKIATAKVHRLHCAKQLTMLLVRFTAAMRNLPAVVDSLAFTAAILGCFPRLLRRMRL